MSNKETARLQDEIYGKLPYYADRMSLPLKKQLEGISFPESSFLYHEIRN